MDYNKLFEKISMPREGVELYEMLEAKRASNMNFASDVLRAVELHGMDLDACEKLTIQLSEKYGIAQCSFQLYIQLLLCAKAYAAYIENGWDIQVFYDSMSDIFVYASKEITK